MSDIKRYGQGRLHMFEMKEGPFVRYIDHADRIEELERACSEWAEVSQRNYQCAKRYHEALEFIARNQYGLQSIMEDYPDTDSVEYLQTALKYYTLLVNSYKTTAREAISEKDKEWQCPINYPGCAKNCGSYGCGN